LHKALYIFENNKHTFVKITKEGILRKICLPLFIASRYVIYQTLIQISLAFVKVSSLSVIEV